MVLVDDASTDSTLEIARLLADPRIRILVNSNRLGVVLNFERAIREAKGDQIFLCDQDDVWAAGKVRTLSAYLQTFNLVVSDAVLVNGEGAEIARSFFELNGSGGGFLKNFWKNGFVGCCMAFRRELLRDVLPFPRCIPMHDQWIGSVAEFRGGVKFAPERLVFYRRHGGNVSETGSSSGFSFFTKLRFRWNLAIALIKRLVLRIA